jgi:hypothetical protein
MFDPTSRYAHLPVMRHRAAGTEPDEAVAYVGRRFIPGADEHQPVAALVVRASDRVDHLATTAYGEPTQFWRLADANGVRRPDELTEEVGRTVVVPAIGPPPVADTPAEDER